MRTKMDAAKRDAAAVESDSWTLRVRQWIDQQLPMDHLLPNRQPYYVGSWVYVFGVITIAALVWVVVSGVVLSFMGPQWWHGSGVGRFFNSLHFWSVQLFFIFMVLHLWGQYFMAGWRDGRAATWAIGVVFFNVLNFGQMYGLHIMLLPIGVTILVVWHIVIVRARGVVKPIEPEGGARSRRQLPRNRRSTTG